MSDEDWEEEDLDLGYHPTSDIADEPPEVDDEEIEGAQGALPPDGRPREGVDTQTETVQRSPADEIMRAESQYGDAETEDRILDDADDDGQDNDFNTVVEDTYYEQGEEELDYDDDAPVEESTPALLLLWTTTTPTTRRRVLLLTPSLFAPRRGRTLRYGED